MQLEHARKDARFWQSMADTVTGDIEAHKGLLASTQRALSEREKAAADVATNAQAAKGRLARVEKGEAVAGIPAPMTRKDFVRISGMTEAQARHCARVAEIADRGEDWFQLLLDETHRHRAKVDKTVARRLHRLLRQARTGATAWLWPTRSRTPASSAAKRSASPRSSSKPTTPRNTAMSHVDLAALQQRLAQQQPKPVPAEPPSWSTRPASALRTIPAPKQARPATASAAAPAGTLRATTTMRAALPLKATNARADRAGERARADALRAQIDELNAALVVANAEAERALAEERQRADRLNEQMEALSAAVVRAEKQAEAAVGRAERAEAGRDAERSRAEALRTTIDELKAKQALMTGMHACELAVARHDALAAQQAAAELRRPRAERKARGLLARLRAAWRGE